ncbi:SpaA isopeptide-forming pilin-related protein [uncultured Ellagibacter sp.]|uniref:SpaA isopeptide-forming pilin-related protein n=1 Tax=uncultured Ellagibacter sp. TaxID=2137580 RepID=UPI00260C3B49|nr:SpaA isopeptide-forming pilin-related protein [uncultured Ellagibacter sp.]
MYRSNKAPFKGTLTSKAFSIFLALTLCVPTTLAGNLSHVRQAQADTSAPQEQSTSGDALDSASDGVSVDEAADSVQDAPESPTFASAFDWSAQYQALTLSSKGLKVDAQKLIDSARESGAAPSSGDTQVQAVQSGESQLVGSQMAAPSGAAQSELPSMIPATLDLSFELDPSAWIGDSDADLSAGNQDSATASSGVSDRRVIVPGDWFSVKLPEGLEIADETLALDVFQNDEQGNATTVKIAEATWTGDKIKVSFVAPVDTSSDAAALDSQSMKQASSGDGPTTSTLAASVQLPVTFSSSLVQDTPSTLTWLLQQTATESRSAELYVPSKGDLLSLMGPVPNEGQSNSRTKDEVIKIQPSSKRDGAASFVTLWADNNSGSRPSTAEMMNRQEYGLYFQIEGDDTSYRLYETDNAGNHIVSQDAMRLLGMTQEDLDNLRNPDTDCIVQVARKSTNSYEASASELYSQVVITTQEMDEDGSPALDDEGNPIYKETRKNITWSIKHDGVNEGETAYDGAYIDASREDYPGYINDGQEVMQLLGDVVFNFTLRIGDEAKQLADLPEDERLDTWFRKWGVHQKLILKKNVNGKEEDFSELIGGPEADNELYRALKDGSLDLSISNDGQTAVLGPARWPMYHPDGSAFVYSLQQEEAKSTKTFPDGSTYSDYYQVVYNNLNTLHYGSDTTEVHNNGTMIVTHKGDTRVDAHKLWLDDDASERPKTKFSLWRYSLRDGAGPDSASQVTTRDDGGSYITLTLSAEESKEAGDSAIDLGELFREQYPDCSIAKYDPAGYPYVYLIREEGVSGYETLFGLGVSEDGSATGDTGANYYSADFESTIAAGGDALRADGDESLYMGGTIINRRCETTKQTLAKTWEAGSFQDQLADVEVTFQLERIQKEHAKFDEDRGYWVANGDTYEVTDPDTGDTFQYPYDFQYCDDVPHDAQFKMVTGWTSENLTQEVSADVPRYDKDGKEWVYRWNEVSVTKAGDPMSYFMQDTDPDTGLALISGDFFVFSSITDAQGANVPLHFKGEYDKERGVLVNRYVDETTAQMQKWWWNENSQDYTQDTNDLGYEARPVTVTLLRNNEVFGEFTVSGTQSEKREVTSKDNSTAFFCQETTPWVMDFTGLPKYDENGSEYDYMVVEGSMGYFQQHQYTHEDPETGLPNVTKIWNKPGSGGSLIRVSKAWEDGGNTSARVPVKVGIFAKHDIFEDGELKYTQDAKIGEATLSYENAWYEECYVPTSGLSQEDDVYIRELSVSDADSASNNYAIVTRDDVLAAPEGSKHKDLLVNWPETNQNNPFNERMVGFAQDGGHAYIYEVDYGTDGVLGSLEVRNKRIGNVNIAVDKSWTDAGANPSERPSACFVLSSTNAGVSFHADNAGDVYVTAGDDQAASKSYVFTSSNLQETAIYNTKVNPDWVWLADENGNRVEGDEGAKLVVRIDSSTATSRTAFALLPKYDAKGFVVDWNVEEAWLEDSGDYSSVRTSYTCDYSSKWHYSDSIAASYNNKRVQTKDVTFFTAWYDGYVNEVLNQRPDVFLTLWRQVYQYDADGNLVMDADGVHPRATLEKVTGYKNYSWESIDDYHSSATIRNLPRYDSHGKEIVYYASCRIGTSEDAAKGLDYTDQWLTYSANDPDPGNPKWDQASVEVSSAVNKVSVGSEAEGGMVDAVREDGTFNFKIENSIDVSGEKIWRDLPFGFDEADLPGISIYLQRRLANGTYDEAGNWVQGEALPWQDLKISKTADGGYSVASVDNAADGAGVADGKTAVAWTGDVKKNASGGYGYSISSYGSNAEGVTPDAANSLPRYDQNGHLYEYRATELVRGLENKPGGFTADDLAENGAGQSADSVFVTSGTPGSYRVINTYQSDTGKLTVKKLYEGMEPGDEVPDTTFTLYRYYVTRDGKRSTAERVASHTLSAGEITTAVSVDGQTGAGVQTGVGHYTFDNLEVYTPSGEYWVYYIAENGIDGFQTLVSLGDKSLSDADFSWGNLLENGSWGSPDLGEPQYNYDKGAFDQPEKTIVANDETPDVTFRNSYYPEDTLTSLQGKKTWQDQGNAFGLRPEDITLQVTRTYQNGIPDAQGQAQGMIETMRSLVGLDSSSPTGVIELQSDNAEAPNYLQWNKSADANTWVYTISNLEQYAPDGKPWRYTVKEVLPDGSQYLVDATSNGGTVSADNHGEGGFVSVPTIDNYLKGKLTVVKKWDDDLDADWKQRPSLTVRVQAKVEGGEWGDAGEVLKTLGITDESGNALAGLEVGGKFQPFEKTWLATDKKNQGVGEYSYTWKSLPTLYSTAGGQREISWRVVESKLTYDAGSAKQTEVPIASPDETGSYLAYKPYQPSQSTSSETNEKGELVSTSEITNTLNTTSISVVKTWDDGDNEWASRPGTQHAGDTWNLTYALQRTTTPSDASSWRWLSEYGADIENPFADDQGSLNPKLLMVVLSGTENSASATFGNLPETDPSGTAYAYRLVEQVKGSYSASGTPVATSKDGKVQLVASQEGQAASEFTNRLNTIDITGKKLFNDYGTGMAPQSIEQVQDVVKLKVQRSVDGASWVDASKDGGVADEPMWKQVDGTWVYSYSGLPKTDQAGNVYRYRVIEVGDCASGFYESYADDASVDGQTGNVSAATITNTSTSFTMDKVGDDTTGSRGETLTGAAFEFWRDGERYARWQRDDEGSASSVVWPTGTSSQSSDPGIQMQGANQGFIVGLPAGTYTVKETSVPAGHVKAADFAITIAADGTVASASASRSDVAVTVEGNVATVTVTDAVVRGEVELCKYYDHNGDQVPVAKMTFDLYKGIYDENAENGGGVCIATGLVTDSSGSWRSRDDAQAVYKNTGEAFAEFAKYYQRASDGLPEGSYYFIETGTSSNTIDAQGKYFAFEIAQSETSQPSVKLDAENDEFNAAAELEKVNAETGAVISGAQFTLSRDDGTESGSLIASGLESGKTYALDATGSKVESSSAAEGGMLKLTGLKKGSYILAETRNLGYSLGDEAPIQFTVDNDDSGATLSLGTDGKLSNMPLHGAIHMEKIDSATGSGISGAEFALEQKGSDGTWAVVAEGIVSGKSYRANVADDGSIISLTEAVQTEGRASYERGALLVTNLPWGTYRFVETKAAAGYAGVEDGQWAVSGEATVSAENVEATLTTPIAVGQVANSPIDFSIRKTDPSGTVALAGAQFRVVPKEGSAFADGAATKEFETDASGNAQPVLGSTSLKGQLIAGNSYVVAETKAPEGFSLPEASEIEIVISDDGVATCAGSALPEGWDLSSDGSASVLTAKDEPTSIIVYKRDQNGNPLLGSEFKIKGVFAGGATEMTIAPEGDGASVVTTGLLIAGNVYTIEETKAPIGYEKLPKATFKIAASGGIEPIGVLPAGWQLADGGAIVTAVDTPIEVVLAKKSSTGLNLGNATFSIEGEFRNQDGEVEQATRPYTTGLDGTVLVDGLLSGTRYTLKETQAPAGYILDDSLLEFTVKEDGTVETLSPQTDHGFSVLNGQTVTITKTDDAVSLQLAKLGADSGDARLTGAEFTVEGSFAKDATSGVLEQRTFEGLSVDEVSSLRFATGQTYILTETKAPAGYELIEGSLKFTVADDGRIYEGDTDASSVSNGEYRLLGDHLGIVAVDQPIEIELAKFGSDKGTDTPDKALAGATFRIGGVFADGETGVETVRELSMEGGTCTLRHLVAGNVYRLWEVAAPAGYKLIEGTLSFRVHADGTIEQVDAEESSFANGSMSIAEDAVSVQAVDDPIELSLVKKDEAGDKLLAGAVFKVTPVGGSSFADGTTESKVLAATGADGKTSLSGQLVAGSCYEITEVSAPAGYTVPNKSLTVEVAADGTMKAQGSVPVEFKATTSEVGATIITVFTGEVWDDPTRMHVQKVSSLNALEKLENASFLLSGVFADGTAERSLTTDSNGMAELDKALLIADGKTVYTLTETCAPEGYRINAEAFTFTVATDGSLVPVAGQSADAGYSVVGEGGIVVSAEDYPIELVIQKKASDGSADSAMKGARFTITPKQGSAFADGTTMPKEFETDERGLVSCIAQLVAGGSYDLAETRAPKGYKLIEETFTFTVNPDGTITAGSSAGEGETSPAPAASQAGWTISNGAGEARVIAVDAPLKVGAVKLDEGGSALSGAQFSLEGNFPDGSTSKSFVSDSAGVLFSGLQLIGSDEGERYVLREVSAPAGYQVLDPVTLLVYSDGRLALGADVSADLAAHVTISEREGAAWVAVTDDPAPSDGEISGSDSLAKTGDAPLAQAALVVLVASGAGVAIARRRRGTTRRAR